MRRSAVINAVPSLILRSPLHALMSERFLVLTWQGRKTGRTYSTPVAYAVVDGRIVMTTDDRWWLNFQRPAPVELMLRGRSVSGTAVAIPDQWEVRRALDTLVAQQPAYPKLARMPLLASGDPDLDAAIAAGRVLVSVEVGER